MLREAGGGGGGADPGYRIKNKNPTQSCGELSVKKPGKLDINLLHCVPVLFYFQRYFMLLAGLMIS